MTEIVVNIRDDIRDDKKIIHVFIIPFKNVSSDEIIRRLHLKYVWRYLLVVLDRDKEELLDDETLKKIEGPIIINIYKMPINPIYFFKQTFDSVSLIKKQYINKKNTNEILIWIDYDYNLKEPIILYFILKKEGKWNFIKLFSYSFIEVENEIKKNECFTTTKICLQRFIELKKEFN